MCHDTNTYRKSMVLILGLKHRYVNVPTGAWQEKYPFRSEREPMNGSYKTTNVKEQMRSQTQIHIIIITQRHRIKKQQQHTKTNSNKRYRERNNAWVKLNQWSLSHPVNLIIKYVCQRHRCCDHLLTAHTARIHTSGWAHSDANWNSDTLTPCLCLFRKGANENAFSALSTTWCYLFAALLCCTEINACMCSKGANVTDLTCISISVYMCLMLSATFYSCVWNVRAH